MATKNSGPTFQTIQQQIARLEAEAEAIRSKERGKVIEQVRAAIRDYGLTAAEVGLRNSRGKAAKADPAPRKLRTRNKPAKKTARAAKFADGQGNTWSGVGKRPNWFKEALAAGKKPEDLMAAPA